MSYYLKKGSREIGPLEAENLVALLQGGDCLPTDLIRREEDAEGPWVTAATLFPDGSWTRQEVEPTWIAPTNPLAVTIRELLNEDQDQGVSRKLVEALSNRLRRGERVQAVSVQKHLVSVMHLVTEAIVTTSERVLLVRDLILGKHIEEIGYEDLAEIAVQKELLGAVVTIETRDQRKWKVGSLPKESAEKVVRAVRARKEQMSAGANASVNANASANATEMPAAPRAEDLSMMRDDPLARLKKLKELLDEGVITEADYEEKKREILPLL